MDEPDIKNKERKNRRYSRVEESVKQDEDVIRWTQTFPEHYR